MTHFSAGTRERHELDDAAADLALDAVEVNADGHVVLHFVDTCGEHFPEGFWPAVHIDETGAVVDVTVES